VGCGWALQGGAGIAKAWCGWTPGYMTPVGPQGGTLIGSVGYDQGEILRNILQLHVGAPTFDLDPCFGSGSFYRGEIPEPRLRYDIEPQRLDVKRGDVRALDLPSASLKSVVFDGPFLHSPGRDSIMGQRFGGYPTQRSLRVMYFGALAELWRVLRTGGVLVVKTQDIVESGRQVWNHIHVANMAENLGFEMIDLFVLVRKHAMTGHNHSEQRHCRKLHSYFLVFRKGRRR
jgi:hypothetical protein